MQANLWDSSKGVEKRAGLTRNVELNGGNEMKIMLWFLLLATTFQPCQSTNPTTQSFRIIPILKRENGYGNFESMAFVSKDELNSFLKNTATQIGWNNRQEFEDALRNAKVDFTKEALVLLRHDEGSGSVQVTFEPPLLQDGRLICKIQGKRFPPGYGGTADMAYYCFAVVVSKAAVTEVELQRVQGGFSERRLPPVILPIRQPSNKS